VLDFKQLDFAHLQNDVDQFDLYWQSELGNYYRLDVIDSSMSRKLVVRTLAGDPIGIGVDSPAANIFFKPTLENYRDVNVQYALHGFYLRNVSFVFAPTFSFDRDELYITFAQKAFISRMEADMVVRVNQSVAINTFMTHALHGFTINGTNSQFAVTGIAFTALLTKSRIPPHTEGFDDTSAIEENYDAVVALFVCGGICGSILVVVCIIGIVKLATRKQISNQF
jgi:hypothetical protein